LQNATVYKADTDKNKAIARRMVEQTPIFRQQLSAIPAAGWVSALVEMQEPPPPPPTTVPAAARGAVDSETGNPPTTVAAC